MNKKIPNLQLILQLIAIVLILYLFHLLDSGQIFPARALSTFVENSTDTMIAGWTYLLVQNLLIILSFVLVSNVRSKSATVLLTIVFTVWVGIIYAVFANFSDTNSSWIDQFFVTRSPIPNRLILFALSAWAGVIRQWLFVPHLGDKG